MNTEEKARILMRYMQAAERTLKLIELKAPVVILASDMQLIREAAFVLEDMAGEEWQEVVNQAHDDLLTHKKGLRQRGFVRAMIERQKEEGEDV